MKLFDAINHVKEDQSFLNSKSLMLGLAHEDKGFEYCNHTDCIGFNESLCDYPMGDGKTCDYGMCGEHSHQIGEDLHYCKTHYELWLQAKPKELHVEEEAIGYLVDQVFYPMDKAWVARNKAVFLNKPLMRVFAEKID